MASLRSRSVLLAAAFVAGTALLTACQGDTTAGASAAPATASSTKAAAGGKNATTPEAIADAHPSSSSNSGNSDSNPPTAKSGPESVPKTAGDTGKGKVGKGVSGTWFGNVSYLAPGKYTVSGPKGEEQAFFTADNTEIWGAGDICGDANGQSAVKCTEQELQAAARKGVSAEVKISNGIATRITEDH
ncbi:hypothetical protein [Streptomyces sp. SID13588]|uniref:hypothetical protein n=1 Tax=Streptomyces sp. SID13588 TaxID=2706051 RepID=UPI0019446095|nr:hypothetical protein [Streptomyces sp. SID13588]